MMANMNSPDDMDGFQLLRDAVKMNVLVILMSNDDDASTTMRALEQGAFLCIKKPITMQIVEYLWEHVVRENANALKPNKLFGEKDQMDSKQNKSRDAEGETNSNKTMNLRILKHDNNKFKRKVWTRWTKELHEKFMDAVTQLGEGRCYPKEILELMNVPELTRMQVASHLQVCFILHGISKALISH
ncbi:two-component response regulator arr2 [Phtheirospermum japonicum]|uniref:Two-component response regulator arr2 n=1 Tax=Phtheirospermum japonicum TaxID=374723 RepID=A0A830D0J9_9LAMI|nr:two-component response regulator arr2 [Phtheirospermum japonicum]